MSKWFGIALALFVLGVGAFATEQTYTTVSVTGTHYVPSARGTDTWGPVKIEEACVIIFNGEPGRAQVPCDSEFFSLRPGLAYTFVRGWRFKGDRP